MKLSVIVPIYNALEDVKLCLESLCKHLNFDISEVILVNDCSNESTTLFLEKFIFSHSVFKYIKNSENCGFVESCNKGMEQSKGNIVVLLNSDTQIPSYFSEKIIDCFNSDKLIGIASPISSSSLKHFIELPKNLSVESMNKLLDSKHKAKYPQIFAAEGFCFCIRKEVILELGYLDKIYKKGYCEETDYALKAKQNGWKNVLIDNLYVYHKTHSSFSDEQRLKLFEENNKIFTQRWRQEIKKAPSGTPVSDIEDRLFLNPLIYFLFKIFSIRKSKRSMHYIITILFLKFKIKRKK